MNQITLNAVDNAVRALFYILQRTSDEDFKQEIQNMIDILYKKYPNSMPCPSK